LAAYPRQTVDMPHGSHPCKKPRHDLQKKFAPAQHLDFKRVAKLVDAGSEQFYLSVKKWARHLLAAIHASKSDWRLI
jgi:hypothetical protein